MKLLVSLLRNAFLDEVEDEKMWNQINLLALASNTSVEVRKNALYFIMEQLTDGSIPIEKINVQLVNYVYA